MPARLWRYGLELWSWAQAMNWSRNIFIYVIDFTAIGRMNLEAIQCYRFDCNIIIHSVYYSKVSNKRTVFNNRTGGDIFLQKV